MTDTVRICVFGIVQGVGFRPFVSRIAIAAGICGTVCNKGSYVEIIAQGETAALASFQSALAQQAPPRSAILKIDCEEAAKSPAFADFTIVESTREAGAVFVSPDIAVCETCKKELFDRHDRRYLHPFINCTACGPRLTILDSMPYDRERTSMGDFPMCRACRDEYYDSASRRYDAQPVCCNECGPVVYVYGGTEQGAAAITAARRSIAGGGIVAVKGIGGFHLCCDGTNEAAVKRLRRLKRRPVKPFALMLRDLAAVRRECVLPATAEPILDGHAKPIILLAKKAGGLAAPSVAPHNPAVGVMLPYAPLQLLLFTYPDGVDMPDVLVMTSANASGAPICRTDEDAARELTGLCDMILSHNRTIRLRADDSVMRFYRNRPYMIRRSRGYAPLPVMGPEFFKGAVLAIGGELKNTFCLAKDALFYLSPYVGDLGDVRTMAVLRESVARLEELLEVRPTVVACDLHPLYHSAQIAAEQGLPLIRIQHHYAHILSCLAENGVDREVLGIAFDGTGYGTDGTIWGGEILQVSYSGFRRVASIRPFRQPGGDSGAREGWRIAVSLLYDGNGDKAATQALVKRLALATEAETAAQFFLADEGLNSVVSTSAGRLFDAVSAVLGLCRISTFEGEAAMALQFAAEEWEKNHGPAAAYTDLAPEADDGRLLLPTDRLFQRQTADFLAGAAAGLLAYRFHASLALMTTAVCVQLRRTAGLGAVALSGGVFQNTLLLRLCEENLAAAGFHVYTHSLVPANDGGIALGQAVAAMYSIQQR